MEIAMIFESLAPWLGGGAVTVAATFTVWLWINYFKRDSVQKDHGQEILDETRKDREYWRELAMNHQNQLVMLEEQNSELRKQNRLLEVQNQILKDDKARLMSYIEKQSHSDVY